MQKLTCKITTSIYLKVLRQEINEIQAVQETIYQDDKLLFATVAEAESEPLKFLEALKCFNQELNQLVEHSTKKIKKTALTS